MNPLIGTADPLWTTATSAITDNVTALGTFLGVAFTVTVAFIVYKLVKRGANKA
jgi:hypothetical protein